MCVCVHVLVVCARMCMSDIHVYQVGLKFPLRVLHLTTIRICRNALSAQDHKPQSTTNHKLLMIFIAINTSHNTRVRIVISMHIKNYTFTPLG